MSKISKIWSRVEACWYSELRNVARYNEADFDSVIQSQLETIFPYFIFVAYKKRIIKSGAEKGSVPDFALIRADYKEWWIVEVETIGDDLRHVRKQIDDFTSGSYNSIEQAKYIFDKNKSLDLKKLKELTDSPPKVLVIVDDIDSKWILGLEEFKPTVCVFRVFINSEGIEMYSIGGDYPYILEEYSHCQFSSRSLLELSNPDVLEPEIPNSGHKQSWLRTALEHLGKSLGIRREENDRPVIYKIAHRGRLTEWKKLEDDNKTYLQPLQNDHTLRVTSQLVLKRVKDRQYLIEVI